MFQKVCSINTKPNLQLEKQHHGICLTTTHRACLLPMLRCQLNYDQKREKQLICVAKTDKTH